MGKYLPGKAWALFLRAGLVRGPRTTAGLAAVTAFYEVFVTMSAAVLTAAVLFALLLPPSSTRLGSGRVRHQLGAMLEEITKGDEAPMNWQRLRTDVTNSDVPGAPLDRTLALALSLGLLVPLLALILPPAFNRMAHRATLPFRDRDTPLPPLGWRALAEGLVATGLNWFCQGASVWAGLQGVLPRPPAWTGAAWGLLTAVMGVAYVAGFVILLAPSGLGVREFFLTMFLVALLGTSSAAEEASVLLAVLVLRLVATAAEVVTVALVWKLPGPPVLAPLSPPGREEKAEEAL
jgi:hypothetical protein